jgi:hypothetical protein
MPNVEKVQAGYQARTLSAFTVKPAPAAAPKIDWPAINPELTRTRFFEYLDLVLDFAPPSPEEAAIRGRQVPATYGHPSCQQIASPTTGFKVQPP